MDNEKQLNEATTLIGTVEYITYQNQNNGYTVFNLSNSVETVTCVGVIPSLELGVSVKLSGSYGFHSVYGHQFKFDYYEIIAPEGSAAILKYLSSGALKGIGPSTARKIVEKFGSESLEIIESNCERLSEIRGISLSKARSICDEYKKQNGVRDVMMQLGKYGITAEESNRIYKVLGKDTIAKIEKNPFALYNDDIGFGFERVCKIAAFFKVSIDNENRIAAGMRYILQHNLLNGHTCLPKEKLTQLSCQLLECDDQVISDVYETMQRDVIIKQASFNNKDYVFLTKYYTAERYVASKFKIMLDIKPRPLSVQKGAIARLEKSFKIKYQEKQIEAINMALEKGLLVLTGGPGTGKSATRSYVKSISAG